MDLSMASTDKALASQIDNQSSGDKISGHHALYEAI